MKACTLYPLAFLVALAVPAFAANGETASTLSELDAGIAQKNAAIAAHRDDSCGNVGKLLERMFDVDQFARSSLGPICPTWEKNCLLTAWPRVMAIDDVNLKILKSIIARYSWHELKACGGKDAQLHAWLLVQHADRDTPFQHAVLVKTRGVPRGRGERNRLCVSRRQSCDERKETTNLWHARRMRWKCVEARSRCRIARSRRAAP